MHLLSPILWPRPDLKWLCSSRTLSCFCARQQSAPSANTQALIINPLKGLVRPQCSYYQMTRHYFWPFPCSPPQPATAAACGRSAGVKKWKKTSDLFKTVDGAQRGWRVSEGFRHDSMMIVTGKLKQQVYLPLLRCLRISQDRERISLNLTARIEESAVSARQACQWAAMNCLVKKRPWWRAIHRLSHSKYLSSFLFKMFIYSLDHQTCVRSSTWRDHKPQGTIKHGGKKQIHSQRRNIV